MRDIEPILPPVISGYERCLICGEPNEASALECSYGCGFKCHDNCLRAHTAVKELLLPGSSVHAWNCDYISFWIGRVAVDDILADDDLDKNRVNQLIKLNHIEKVKQHRDSRKRRYDVEADDLMCNYCGQLVPVEQTDHLWSHCTGIDGPPLSNDVFESIPNIKRRCLTIVQSATDRNVSEATPITYRDALLNNSTVVARRERTDQQAPSNIELTDPVFVDVNSLRPTPLNNSTFNTETSSTRRKRNRHCQLDPQERQFEMTLSNRFSELSNLPDSTMSSTSSIVETARISRGPLRRSKRLAEKRKMRSEDRAGEGTESRITRLESTMSQTAMNDGKNLPIQSQRCQQNRQLTRSQSLPQVTTPVNIPRSSTQRIQNVNPPPARRSRRLMEQAMTLQSTTPVNNLPNNVETLMALRGQNFRLDNRSDGSQRHSDEPDAGAPGLPPPLTPDTVGSGS